MRHQRLIGLSVLCLLALAACQPRSVFNVTLTPTLSMQTQHTEIITVDNCRGFFAKHQEVTAGQGTITLDKMLDMQVFRELQRTIRAQHPDRGAAYASLDLRVPARQQIEFTVEYVEENHGGSIRYEDTAGQINEAHYSTWLKRDATITQQRTLACP